MIRTSIAKVGTAISRLWQDTVPDVKSDTHSFYRGMDSGSDRANAPKTTPFSDQSNGLSPPRAAPPPPSRHRPGTALDPASDDADAGVEADLCRPGGASLPNTLSNDMQNIKGSKNAPRQKFRMPARDRCLRFIRRYVAQYGHGPSYAKIMAGAHIASKSGVHRQVWQLVEDGYLVNTPGRHQAIMLAPEKNRPLANVSTKDLREELELRARAA